MNDKILNYCYCALGSILISVCSVITVPSVIPFTLQTFAVFCVLNLLGGKYGTVSILIYLLIGITGLPVFSGFAGGIGVLMSNTGGYLFGFVLSGLIYLLLIKLLGNHSYIKIPAMLIGTAANYICGTLWFIQIYSQTNDPVGFGTALSMCVLPFIIPDLIKLILAYLLSERLRKALRLNIR